MVFVLNVMTGGQVFICPFSFKNYKWVFSIFQSVLVKEVMEKESEKGNTVSTVMTSFQIDTSDVIIAKMFSVNQVRKRSKDQLKKIHSILRAQIYLCRHQRCPCQRISERRIDQHILNQYRVKASVPQTVKVTIACMKQIWMMLYLTVKLNL
jgi:hypothetical protein